jgi:hypothetical protein
MRNEQLFPPRPSREELFYIAEKWIEGSDRTAPVSHSPVHEGIARGAVSPLGVTALSGEIINRFVSDYLRDRRESSRRAQEKRILEIELLCRDLRAFDDIDQLARHIVVHERP